MLARYFPSSINLFVFALLGVFASAAQAQVNEWTTTNCPALKVPAQQSLVSLCNGHTACAMMVAQQGDSCIRVQRFLSTLDAAMGPATPGLFGLLGGRRVTPEAVWQASLPEEVRQLEQRPEWKALIDRVESAVPAAAPELRAGANTRGVKFVVYSAATEQVGTGTASGPGTLFFSNGMMRRAVYVEGKYERQDWVTLAGQRAIAFFRADGASEEGRERQANGNEFTGTFNRENLTWLTGTQTNPDRRRWEGQFANDRLSQGKEFRADGTLVAEGTFDANGQLVLGRRFDASGTAVTENVDVAKAQADAAASARDLAERQRREQETARAAEERRLAAEEKRLAAAKEAARAAEERELQQTLRSGNAGQLFALADRLAGAGNAEKARDVRRTLIERFPNHPLAATAAQQMAGASPTSTTTAAASPRPTSGGSGMSCRDAVSRLQEALSAAGNERERKALDSAGGNQVQEQILWVTNFYTRAVNQLPQCANDAAYRKRFDDDLAATRQNCPSRTRGPANCTAGANYYIDERQVQAVFQQLLGQSGGPVAATATGTVATASGCAGTPDATLARFNSQLQDFMSRNPNPTPSGAAGSGARAQYQWSLFVGTEGLKLLEPLRTCLGPHYAANKTALEGMRDRGLEGCRKLSTDPSSCVPRPAQ